MRTRCRIEIIEDILASHQKVMFDALTNEVVLRELWRERKIMKVVVCGSENNSFTVSQPRREVFVGTHIRLGQKEEAKKKESSSLSFFSVDAQFVFFFHN